MKLGRLVGEKDKRLNERGVFAVGKSALEVTGEDLGLAVGQPIRRFHVVVAAFVLAPPVDRVASESAGVALGFDQVEGAVAENQHVDLGEPPSRGVLEIDQAPDAIGVIVGQDIDGELDRLLLPGVLGVAAELDARLAQRHRLTPDFSAIAATIEWSVGPGSALSLSS